MSSSSSPVANLSIVHFTVHCWQRLRLRVQQNHGLVLQQNQISNSAAEPWHGSVAWFCCRTMPWFSSRTMVLFMVLQLLEPAEPWFLQWFLLKSWIINRLQVLLQNHGSGSAAEAEPGQNHGLVLLQNQWFCWFCSSHGSAAEPWSGSAAENGSA
ncbi:uncharacterized protein G2W53_014995 [Senna tora]|uniref:Uncharacterized protein n=1 Tax=Senna tora TaxID=362788 RepID=A0A834WUN9_9FABA|nr:uncharacterized protein G2W53_014995 [Senna tora]